MVVLWLRLAVGFVFVKAVKNLPILWLIHDLGKNPKANIIPLFACAITLVVFRKIPAVGFNQFNFHSVKVSWSSKKRKGYFYFFEFYFWRIQKLCQALL